MGFHHSNIPNHHINYIPMNIEIPMKIPMKIPINMGISWNIQYIYRIYIYIEYIYIGYSHENSHHFQCQDLLDLRLDFHLTPLPLESQDPGSSSPGPTAHSALTALGIYGEDKKIVHFIVQYNIDSINNALLLCDHH